MINKATPFILYALVTLGCFLLWIPFPDCYHFAGASSLMYSFVFAVGSNNPVFARIVLCCIPVVVCLFCVAIGLIVKRNNSFLFFSLMAVDLIVSLAFVIMKVCTNNYVGIGYMIVGIISRTLYLLWAVRFTQKPQ